MTADVAPDAWLKAVEGTITTRHNHIVVRSDQHGLGWLSWAGLGSLMEPIRGGAGKGGCLHPTREIALDKALARVRALRAEAISLLESRLDGWAWEAISLRINPSSTMRCLSGWQPPEVEICVHEPDDSEPKGSYQTPVVERIADPLPGRFAGYRAEDGC